MTYEHGQPSFRIDSYIDKDLETIELVQTDTISGAIQRDIMRLREEATRQALIELGWTPPAKDKSPRTV